MNPAPNPQLSFILGRRSIRAYRPTPVSDEVIGELLAAAMAAPSACGKDPWRFVVVRNRMTLEALAAALPNGKMLASAPLGIVVCGDLGAAHAGELSYLLQDCSAAIENLLLAAHAQGLGACWVGIHPGEPLIRQVRDLLSLPATVVPVAAVSLGQPGEQLPARTRYNASYVHTERW